MQRRSAQISEAGAAQAYDASLLNHLRISTTPNLLSAQPDRGWSFWWKPALFLLVACIGLYYVKWSPYYLKAFVAADNHSIGASIINDQLSDPLTAALAYAKVYRSEEHTSELQS